MSEEDTGKAVGVLVGERFRQIIKTGVREG